MREEHQLGSYACAYTLIKLEISGFGLLERKTVLKIRPLESWPQKEKQCLKR